MFGIIHWSMIHAIFIMEYTIENVCLACRIHQEYMVQHEGVGPSGPLYRLLLVDESPALWRPVIGNQYCDHNCII